MFRSKTIRYSFKLASLMLGACCAADYETKHMMNYNGAKHTEIEEDATEYINRLLTLPIILTKSITLNHFILPYFTCHFETNIAEVGREVPTVHQLKISTSYFLPETIINMISSYLITKFNTREQLLTHSINDEELKIISEVPTVLKLQSIVSQFLIRDTIDIISSYLVSPNSNKQLQIIKRRARSTKTDPRTFCPLRFKDFYCIAWNFSSIKQIQYKKKYTSRKLTCSYELAYKNRGRSLLLQYIDGEEGALATPKECGYVMFDREETSLCMVDTHNKKALVYSRAEAYTELAKAAFRYNKY